MRFNFIRPISRIEEGAYQHALIAWDKRAHIMEAKPSNNYMETVEVMTTEWKYYFQIDLWLVKIQFSFTSSD